MGKVSARHDCTVVLVGDNKVGKTALATKFRTKQFDPSYNRTSSVETLVTSTPVDGIRVKFNIHDTAGELRLQTFCV